MKALVHLGMNKAGSSTVQAWLRLNADSLAENGYHYWLFPHPNPNAIAANQPHFVLRELAVQDREDNLLSVRKSYGLKTPVNMKQFAKRLESQFRKNCTAIPDTDTVVISSEYFAAGLNDRTLISGFRDWMDAQFDQVTFVLYLRPQPGWITSLYSQSLRNGGTVTLPHFVRKQRRPNYFGLVQDWAETVGRDRLILRLLDRDVLKNGDLVDDFADCLGVDPTAYLRPENQNEGFTNQQALDLLTKNLGGDPPLVWFAPDEAGQKLKLNPELLQIVEDANRNQNEKIRSEFFPKRDVLFSK